MDLTAPSFKRLPRRHTRYVIEFAFKDALYSRLGKMAIQGVH